MDKTALLRSKKLYLFDMDGTIYLGNQLFSFTPALLDGLKAAGIRYMFMTNNSSKSVEDYIKKMARLGIKTGPEDFITSAQATVYYLKEHYPGRTLYVCGTESLKDELRRESFPVTETPDGAQCIVMGFDTELTFRKLEDVCRLLMQRPDIPYIATHPDSVCPTEFGSVPDCGSVCQMVCNATGRMPVVIGKPQPLMPRLAMERSGISREETAVVGDRLNTDIKSGLNAGVTGILVMTGETTPEILANSPDKPDLVLQSAEEILKAIR